jgi:hypothetical protein
MWRKNRSLSKRLHQDAGRGGELHAGQEDANETNQPASMLVVINRE